MIRQISVGFLFRNFVYIRKHVSSRFFIYIFFGIFIVYHIFLNTILMQIRKNTALRLEILNSQIIILVSENNRVCQFVNGLNNQLS